MLEAVLVTRDVSVTGEQGLHSTENFSSPHPTPPARRLGVHKKWEGITARATDPADSRDIVYHRTPCSAIKLEGRLANVSAQGQPRHWAVDGEQLFSSAALVFLVFWGCKMGYAFGEQDLKERACFLCFGFVLLQPVMLPKILHNCSCEWLLFL